VAARLAREVGKALGFEEEQIERLSSLMGHWELARENDTMSAVSRRPALT